MRGGANGTPRVRDRRLRRAADLGMSSPAPCRPPVATSTPPGALAQATLAANAGLETPTAKPAPGMPEVCVRNPRVVYNRRTEKGEQPLDPELDFLERTVRPMGSSMHARADAVVAAARPPIDKCPGPP